MPDQPKQPGPGPRRAADRHYLAVVAAEARRLARELRPPGRSQNASRRPIVGRPQVNGRPPAEGLR
jgi:hypothetical protein